MAKLIRNLIIAAIFAVVSIKLLFSVLEVRQPGSGDHQTPTSQTLDITAVHDCQLRESSIICVNEGQEFVAQIPATATYGVPPSFTGCHHDGPELYCLSPDGKHAKVQPVQQDASPVDSEDAPEERHCHFHAGVEHCTGGSPEKENKCQHVEREYNIPLRIAFLFAMLAASAIGVFAPILVSALIPTTTSFALIFFKQFGTGVVISTAFVHLFIHSCLLFRSECIGDSSWASFEGTPAVILMAGMLTSFLMEFSIDKVMKSGWLNTSGVAKGLFSSDVETSTDVVKIMILEMGIIAHSLLIGVTLVVAGDSFFLTLAIVIMFHQMFEGIALGSRIAALGTAASGGIDWSHSHSHSQLLQPEDSFTSKSSRGDAESLVPLSQKILMGCGFAFVTPIGMIIGILLLNTFNGNDPTTIILMGSLDAFSAGILVWFGVVEMWFQDWMEGGEMAKRSTLETGTGLFALVSGMALMSFLGQWA